MVVGGPRGEHGEIAFPARPGRVDECTRLDADDAAAGMEPVVVAVRRLHVGPQGTQRQAGLDHRILGAMQRPLDVAPHGGVAGAHVVGLEEGNGTRGGVGMLREGLHHVAGNGVGGDGQ